MRFILHFLTFVFANAIAIRPRTLTADQEVALNVVLSLQYLESGFFNVACERFNETSFTSQGFPNGTYDQICSIAQSKHDVVQIMGNIIYSNGIAPVSPCYYDFPLGDASSFLLESYTISSIALGACLGSLSTYNSTSSTPPPALSSLCEALSTESTFLRLAGGACPQEDSPSSQPLPATWAYNLLLPYIASCPQPDQQPQVTALPPLFWSAPSPNVTLKPPIRSGQFLSFIWEPSSFLTPVEQDTRLFLAMTTGGMDELATFAEMQVSKTTDYGYVFGEATLPQGVEGTVYACLSTFGDGLTMRELDGFGTLAGPVVVLIS